MKNDTKERKKQIGIVIVTHVDYGAALLRAAEHIVGPVHDCTTIQVDVTNDVQDTVARLKEAAGLLDTGMGVIMLTDMFGGTPTNLSLSLLGSFENIEVLTGINLPMLLKVLSQRDSKPLRELAELACDAGMDGIAVAGDILRRRLKATETA